MNMAILMELVYRLGWTLLHSLWIGAAAALVLAAVLALMDRRSAAARYGAAMGAMAMLIAGIGVAFAIAKAPAPPVAQSAIEARAESMPSSSVGASESVPDVDRHTQRQSWNVAEQTQPAVGPALEAAAAGERRWLRPALPWIAGAWAAGVVLLSLWQLGGWVAVQRLKAIGVEAAGREVEVMASRLAERLKLSAAIRIVKSARVETPLVVGWIRPMVLMPAAVLSGLTPRQLEAILAHELAHIRRHDYLINLLQVVAETLLFYHPAAWWISRRIRLEREQCCDDVAVALCGDRRSYVESLAALEEVRLAIPVAMAMSRGGEELVVRVQRLLGMPVERRHRGIYGAAACAVLAILTMAFLTARPGEAAPTREGVRLNGAATRPTATARQMQGAEKDGTQRIYDIHDILYTPDFRSDEANDGTVPKVTPEMAVKRGEELMEAIKKNADDEPWDGASRMSLSDARLVVNASEKAHRIIARMLEQARQGMSQVLIETRFMMMDRDVWEKQKLEMKLDVPPSEKNGRGTKAALLDEEQLAKVLRTVQAERTTSIISAPRLAVFNGQAGFMRIGSEDPDLGAINIETRPVVSEDRKSIKLTLDAKLSGPGEAKDDGGKPKRQVRELHVLPTIPEGKTLAMIMKPEQEAKGEKAGGGVEKQRQVLVAFVKATRNGRETEGEELPLPGRSTGR